MFRCLIYIINPLFLHPSTSMCNIDQPNSQMLPLLHQSERDNLLQSIYVLRKLVCTAKNSCNSFICLMFSIYFFFCKCERAHISQHNQLRLLSAQLVIYDFYHCCQHMYENNFISLTFYSLLLHLSLDIICYLWLATIANFN